MHSAARLVVRYNEGIADRDMLTIQRPSGRIVNHMNVAVSASSYSLHLIRLVENYIIKRWDDSSLLKQIVEVFVGDFNLINKRQLICVN